MIALQLLAQSSSNSSSSNSGSKHRRRRLRRSISNYSIRNTSARNNTTSSTSNNTTMSVHTRLMMVMLTVVLIASHMSVDGLSTASDRGGRKLFGGYRITPKFCRASKTLPRSDPRSHGPTICMFNHECTQRQGEVVGACMDGFLFGACCQIQGTVDSAMVVEQDIVQQSAAAQSYESYGLHMKKPTAGGGVQFDAATGGAALPTRRPTATTTTLAVQQAAAQAPGQFVYSSSGLDDDSINTIDAQLTNGNHYDGDTVSVVSSTVSPPSIYASRPGMPSQPKPQKPSTTLAPSSAPSGTGHAEVYVDDNPTGHDEYPTRIPTGPYGVGPVDTSTADGFTPDHYGLLADDILNSQSSEFTHSDITHPGVDAVLVDENGRPAGLSGYGSVGPEAAEVATTEAAAAKPTVQSTRLTTAKATYARPAFRPKPTKAAAMFTTTLASEPVMYDTTSTGTGSSASGSGSGSSATGTTGTGIGSGPDQLPKPQGTMSDNDIESIESIILMLNDTKTGPQYNASNAAAAAAAAVVTRLPASTTEKLPDSSYRPPSTSYVYSSMPTRRPIQVHSTIASNYGAVDVGETDFHSVRPSGESIADHILTITKRPLLITAASFATTKQPTTQRLPDEIIITAGSSIATLRPTSAGTRPSTRRPTTSTTTTTTGAPSTSYVTGPTTPRPMKTTPTAGSLPSSSRRPTTSKPTNKINPPRRNHTEPASSTVYIFRPTLNAQPASSTTQQQSTHNNNINNNNVVYEHVIQSKPIMQYAAESTAALNVTAATSAPTTSATTTTTTTTEPPVPTVLITPKPTANQVTSNTWSTNAQQQLDDAYSTPLIKAPSTSYVYSPAPTQRPTVTVDHSSVTGGNNDYSTDFGVTNSYPSTGEPGSLPPLRPQAISNDFEDPGYYGPTSTFRPRPHLAASGNTAPATATPTPLIAFDVATVGSGAEDVVTAQFDSNNFPPVRNPNLNITVGGMNAGSPGGGAIGGVGGAPLNDYDIATPVEFVEDAALNDKMGLLVSKIVESLQGNFEQLADVVYDDVVVRDPPVKPAASTKRPATAAAATTKRPVTRATTRKPTQSAVTNAAKPAAAAATTSGVSTRPTARPSARPTVRPAAAAAAASLTTTVTTRRPTSAKATTTVAPTKAPTTVRRTTKKPTTATAAAAAAAATTKRPPVTKLPTSTRRPVTKPPKQIVTTTVAQPVQDEIVEEDDDDDDDEEEEDDDDEEVAAANGEPAEQSTPFAEGRIQCGIRPQVKSGRIVGGKGATFGEFPWQVLVRESTWLGLFTKNKCGGVLISKNYVVTAAHCQPGFLASLVTVFGEFDISGDLEVKRSVTKNVKRVVVHREYDAATFENDLAMLELESPIHYDTHIVPICMPSDAADFTGRMATVTGWGRLKYGGGVPSVLQEVQVPVIENSVCQEMFHTAGHNKKILSSFLCAGYANGQKDSCEGDSGGPLVLQRQDGRWELAGTVSHGIKCAAPYLPGVYMRTTYYKPWLQSIAGVH